MLKPRSVKYVSTYKVCWVKGGLDMDDGRLHHLKEFCSPLGLTWHLNYFSQIAGRFKIPIKFMAPVPVG